MTTKSASSTTFFSQQARRRERISIRSLVGFFCASLCLAATTNVDRSQAGDAEAGKRKARACVTCHDKKGRGTSVQFPHIGGQQEIYLIQQLTEFRDGKRRSEVMAIIAKPLSDEDIADLAAWYASLEWGGGEP